MVACKLCWLKTKEAQLDKRSDIYIWLEDSYFLHSRQPLRPPPIMLACIVSHGTSMQRRCCVLADAKRYLILLLFLPPCISSLMFSQKWWGLLRYSLVHDTCVAFFFGWKLLWRDERKDDEGRVRHKTYLDDSTWGLLFWWYERLCLRGFLLSWACFT